MFRDKIHHRRVPRRPVLLSSQLHREGVQTCLGHSLRWSTEVGQTKPFHSSFLLILGNIDVLHYLKVRFSDNSRDTMASPMLAPVTRITFLMFVMTDLTSFDLAQAVMPGYNTAGCYRLYHQLDKHGQGGNHYKTCNIA